MSRKQIKSPYTNTSTSKILVTIKEIKYFVRDLAIFVQLKCYSQEPSGAGKDSERESPYDSCSPPRNAIPVEVHGEADMELHEYLCKVIIQEVYLKTRNTWY